MLIKFACAQPEITAGRPDLNTQKIINLIKEAALNKADILLLPELAVPGYLIGDLWEQKSFLEDCEAFGEEIISATADYDICVIFGNIAIDKSKVNEDGRVRKYNAAFAAYRGKALGNGKLPYNCIIKHSLPNYREFDDSRYFYSLAQLAAELETTPQQLAHPVEVEIKGQKLKLGIMLCEDGWTENYHFSTPSALAENGSDILCNLSCSPFTLNKNAKRHRLFSAQAQKLALPLAYCNNTGIQNNGKNIFTYDGCSCVYNNNGTLIAEADAFKESLLYFYFDTADKTVKADSQPVAAAKDDTADIYKAVRYGTQKFLQQLGITKMVVGLSGGIDSAVTAALYTDILGPQNVLLVNMPGRYNSGLTKDMALKTAQALKTNYMVVPITESVEHTHNQLTQISAEAYYNNSTFNLSVTPYVMENIQARDRGARILAGAAAAFGGAFSCNSNKTEITIGYATFYGDICGAVAPIGDLWKHDVYAIGRYLNEHVFKKAVIPEEIFTMRPSAELSPEQTVGNGGDPLVYPYHDKLFAMFVESWQKTSPADILRWYAEGTLAEHLNCPPEIITATFKTPGEFIADLERWWKLFCGLAVAKRIQAPPVISITRRAFGYDHREAQLPAYFSREYYKLKNELLKK